MWWLSNTVIEHNYLSYFPYGSDSHMQRSVHVVETIIFSSSLPMIVRLYTVEAPQIEKRNSPTTRYPLIMFSLSDMNTVARCNVLTRIVFIQFKGTIISCPSLNVIDEYLGPAIKY